jgi:hypothetical protein
VPLAIVPLLAFVEDYGRPPRSSEAAPAPSADAGQSPLLPAAKVLAGGAAEGRIQARERQEPADYASAPGPQKKPDPSAANRVVVVGDGMADWLAYGLEDTFAENPEFTILRRHRTTSGLDPDTARKTEARISRVGRCRRCRRAERRPSKRQTKKRS